MKRVRFKLLPYSQATTAGCAPNILWKDNQPRNIPGTRQLFKVTKQSVTTPEKEPSLGSLVDAFYGRASDACAFLYTAMARPPQYPPEVDFNLDKSIDVEPTTPVPLSLPGLLSKVTTAEDLI